MIFGFSLYIISLLVILVTYFRTELGKLIRWKTTREWQDISLPTLEIGISFSQFSG